MVRICYSIILYVSVSYTFGFKTSPKLPLSMATFSKGTEARSATTSQTGTRKESTGPLDEEGIVVGWSV